MGFAFRMQGSRAKRGPTPGLSAPFTDVTGQALGTVITSNTVTVQNIAGGSSITITGGAASGIGGGTSVQYRINSGSFTSSAGTIDPTDTLTLRITTHAVLLGDLSQVKCTIAGIGNSLWNVTTGAPAPAMSGIHALFGLGAQYQSTRGGTPSITSVATSYNTGTSSTTMELQGATHADKNYAVVAGTTNSYPWAPGTTGAGGGALIPMFKGTLTNAMYDPANYIFNVTVVMNLEGTIDNELADTRFFDDGQGQPVQGDLIRGYTFADLDWPRANLSASNSQVVTLFPSRDEQSNPSTFGPSVSNHDDSGRYTMMHAGHPAPTTVGTGGQTANYANMLISLTFNVLHRATGQALHNATIMDQAIIQLIPQ